MSAATIPTTQDRAAYWAGVARQNPDLCKILTPRLTKYIPHIPSEKQSAFLLLPTIEGFYGGAAGGGKSDALLMSAAQYVDIPGYSALLLRRTFKDLALPDAIMDRSHQWWRKSQGAEWLPSKYQWQFATRQEPANITFGYLQHESDVWQYDSAAFQFIGFDELTQFTEFQYRFMFSRLRRPKGSKIPLRARAASNPGGVGHAWVKARFIEAQSIDRIFIPASLEDNVFLDRDAYVASLKQLDPVMYAQRRYGDWEAEYEGAMFKRAWFSDFVDAVPAEALATCRYWDFASTAGGGDWTVGAKVSADKKDRFCVESIRRGQWSPGDVEEVVKQTAALDGKGVMIRIEQEPGASGKTVIDHYVRLLAGYDVAGVAATGQKTTRWRPFAAQCEVGNVYIYSDGSWNSEWLDEMCAVPNASHDDQADATAGAFNEVCKHKKKTYYGISRVGSARKR